MVRAFMSYSHAADGLLAPRVQSALHRLAKPLFSLRAVHVFRDQTTLSATPALWNAIETALNESDFFILMASPAAAASHWVRQEIDHWLTRSPAAERGVARDHFLTVLTEGNILWDGANGDFDWSRTDALPTLLRGAFEQEPLFVDLRFARTDEHLSLHHPEFRSRIGDLAATLHGRPKDELIGEDVRIARRTRRLVSSAVVALALLAGTASVAAWIARVQRNQARSRELAARAVASLDIDPVQSLASAAEAVDIAQTADAVAALRQAIVRSTVRSTLALPARRIVSATLDADGARVLTAAADAGDQPSVQLWDALTGGLLCDVANAADPGFTEDGAAFRTGEGRTYDASSCQPGETIAAQPREPARGPAAEEFFGPASWYSATFPDEAGRFQVAYDDGTAVLRATDSGRIVRRLPGIVDPIGGARFSREPDGASVVVTWPHKDVYTESGGGPTELGDKAARVWGVPYADADRVLAGHRRAINIAELNADATLVATGSDDRTARIWSRRTGEELAVLRGHTAAVVQVGFSGDGARVVTVAEDGTARVWEPWISPARPMALTEIFALGYGLIMPSLPPGDSAAGFPEVSADGRSLLVPVSRSRLIVLDLATGALRGTIVDEESGRLRGALSADGARVVATTGDPTVVFGSDTAHVYDVATGDKLASLAGGALLYTAAFSPEGRTIVMAGEDGTAILFDAARYDILHRLHASDARILHAAFSADGRRLVTASRDALARVWDVRSGAPVLELFGHEGGVTYAAFAADDALIVTAGDDGIRVWDAQSGSMLSRAFAFGDVAMLTPDCARLIGVAFVIDRFEASSQPFGACGAVDAMQALARRRLPAQSAALSRPPR